MKITKVKLGVEINDGHGKLCKIKMPKIPLNKLGIKDLFKAGTKMNAHQID